MFLIVQMKMYFLRSKKWTAGKIDRFTCRVERQLRLIVLGARHWISTNLLCYMSQP